MKIFQFIIGKANKNRPNGVNQVIAGLCKYLSKNKQDIKVVGLASNAINEGEIVKRDLFKVSVYSRWSKSLYLDLQEKIKWCDVVHLHGVYSFPNIIVSMICKKLSVPYVVTLHNGMSPGLSNFKKTIFDFFLQKNHLESAAALHVLAYEEISDILKKCNPKKFIYCPNGIDMDDFTFDNIDKSENYNSNEIVTLGYLGRVDNKKNVTSLIEAINMFSDKDRFHLKIAGPDSKLLQKILNKNPRLSIEWVGPKYGNEKIEFIKSLDLFVHPSKTDVFSIGAMEVLAAGTPLLITRESKASYFYDNQSFFMCEASSQGLFIGLNEAITKRTEWSKRIFNGQELIRNIFNWDTASKKMISGYNDIIQK